MNDNNKNLISVLHIPIGGQHIHIIILIRVTDAFTINNNDTQLKSKKKMAVTFMNGNVAQLRGRNTQLITTIQYK